MCQLEGTVGLLKIGAVRNAVSRLQFEGHEVRLWLPSGFSLRPVRRYVIEGDEAAISLFRQRMVHLVY